MREEIQQKQQGSIQWKNAVPLFWLKPMYKARYLVQCWPYQGNSI